MQPIRQCKELFKQTVRRASLSWRSSIDIKRKAGVGDVLMSTPALREIKRLNPRCRIRFHTDYPSLVKGLPYIDEVLPHDSDLPDSVFMSYEHSVPSKSHLATLIGRSVGVAVKQVKPDCVVREELVGYYHMAWRDLPQPRILIQRQANTWTPNKNWPEEYWNQLIRSLLGAGASVIELGSGDAKGKPASSSAYLDLRGKTDMEELVAAIAAGDIFIGPDSGPYHIAAAVGTSAVMILGGYIAPENTAYDSSVTLSTSPSCSPCWLRTPCPYGLKCLKQILPEKVELAVWKLWREQDNSGELKKVANA